MYDLSGLDLEVERLTGRQRRLAVIRESIKNDPEKFQPLIDHALRVWGHDDDFAWSWLCKPRVKLQNRMPLEAAMEGDDGPARAILGALEHGVAA